MIVLDGASAFEPVDIDPGTYVETIGTMIADQLATAPRTEIATVITHAVEQLGLVAGRSPSSTVSILRMRETRLMSTASATARSTTAPTLRPTP